MLGEVTCILVATAQLIPHMIELATMAVMPLQRLYVLQFPLRSMVDASSRRKMGIIYTCVIWTLMVVVGAGKYIHYTL